LADLKSVYFLCGVQGRKWNELCIKLVFDTKSKKIANPSTAIPIAWRIYRAKTLNFKWEASV